MKKIIENTPLELTYERGKGAWTYHIVIPNTAKIKGKWGTLKVSGHIDDYPLEEINLAPRKDQDKMISINKNIREAIGKGGGDQVRLTLYLLTQDKLNDASEILNSFEIAGVLDKFKALKPEKKDEIITKISQQTTEEKQIELINTYIQQLINSQVFK